MYVPVLEMHLLPLHGYPDFGLFVTVAAEFPLYVTLTLASLSPCERNFRQYLSAA
jgi:hypothetical protein